MRGGEREDRSLVAARVEEPGRRRERRRREQRDSDEGPLALVAVGERSRERGRDRGRKQPHDAEDADGLRASMVVREDGERDREGPLARDRRCIGKLEPAQVAVSRDGPELCDEVPHTPSLGRLVPSDEGRRVLRCPWFTPARSPAAPR